jgi:Cu/Ag efflux pump CusA
LTTVPGSTLPSPYGGAPRQIMVDLDLHALQAFGLTPADVTNAMTAQNITVPSGLAKFGAKQYVVRLNSTPEAVDTLNQVPVKIVNGSPILIRDVAYVRDGGPPQQNIVRQDGVRGLLLTILKNGNASTLSVVNTVKSLLPGIRAAAPKDMKITPLFDQSVFVSGAIGDVVREGAIAAGLTGLMILLFLGSWRSTLIVLVSIPLSILTSLAVLAALGETINIMTLGGLALAVGILVDDATVAIENTYRLLEEGKEFRPGGGAGRGRHREAGADLHLVDLLRVRFGDILDRRAEILVHAAGAGGRVRDAGLLCPVAHPGADPDRRAGEKRKTRPRSRCTAPGCFGRIHAGFERGFSKDLQVAQTIASKLRLTRGAVDVHLQQITNAPEFFVKVDRQRAQELA